MYKHAGREYVPLLFVSAMIFSIGLILGSIAYFSINDNVLSILQNLVLNDGQTYSFVQMFRQCFFTESIWVTFAWLVAQISFMTPFSCAVIGIRGFVLGFTVSFVLYVKDNSFSILAKTIIPQCLFGVPLLTIVTVISVFNALDGRKTNSSQLKGLFIELFALMGAAISALFECLCTRLL